MTRNLRLCRLLFALLVLSAAYPLKGLDSPMVHPNLARGNGEITLDYAFDRINAFNGNLRLDIPLGLSYPLTEDFSYRLRLAYNSGYWDFNQNPDGTVAAEPMGHSNAGLGWDLSLGRLVPPGAFGNTMQRWIYVSPDGSPHPFYSRLHHDVANEVQDVWYSRDGSYLRLRRISPYTVLLEAPRGITRTFVFDAAFHEWWRLVEIRDPFGNRLSIAYGAEEWTLTDSHGRTHRVHFRSDPSGHYPQLVDRVEVAAFGGTAATYSLAYQAANISRSGYDTDPQTAPTVDVPQLLSVTLPDGSAYAFAYAPSGGQRLEAMTLPTLGQVRWGYGERTFQGLNTCAEGLPRVLTRNWAVTSRTTVGANGVVEGTWTYPSRRNGTAPAPGCIPFMEVDERTPLGDIHRYMFTIAAVGDESGNYGQLARGDQRYHTGQALSELIYDCQPGVTGCVLQRAIYRRFDQDAAASPTAWDATQLNRREAATRTIYRDDPHPSGGFYRADVNRFDFDGLGRFRRTETRGNFGRANFKQWIVQYDASTGNYPGVGWSMLTPSQAWALNTIKEVRTSDGAATEVVDYCYDKNTGALRRKRLRNSAASPSANDVLTTFDRDAQGNLVEERYLGGDLQSLGTTTNLCDLPLAGTPDQYRIVHAYEFGTRSASWYANTDGSPMGFRTLDRTIDRSTALMVSQRDVAGLETTYTYDNRGRVTWEKPQVGGGAWVRHTYHRATGGQEVEQAQRRVREELSNGGGQVLSRSTSYDDSFGRPWVESVKLDHTRSIHRGHSYDETGRLAAETAGWVEWDQWLNSGMRKEYLDPDPFGRPRRIVHADGSEEILEYGGVRREMRTFSRGYYHTHLGVVSKPQSIETVYDRQGRVWRKLDTHFTDADWNGDPRTTVTEFRYDVAGRQTAELDPTNGRVARGWTYDQRGFLVEAYHLLEGWWGNHNRVIDSFSQHDPLGRVRLKVTTHGPTLSEQRVERLYDRAGRIIRVRDPVSGHYNWREFVYGTANAIDAAGNVDWRKGRLVEATRHSIRRFDAPYGYWHYLGNIKLTYAYAGIAGRVSRLGTLIFDNQPGGGASSYSQDYTYDDLGRTLRSELSSAQAFPGYTVEYAYDWSTLESVLGTDHLGRTELWIVSQSHRADGGLSRAERGNGVREVIDGDGTPIDRPGQIQLQGIERWDQTLGWVAYTWSSGAHQYDGRGVLVRRGSEYLVPPEWAAPSAAFVVPSQPNPCWEHCVDPEDLLSIQWGTEGVPTTRLYDHLGRSVVVRNHPTTRHSLANLDGLKLWERTPFVEEFFGKWYTGVDYAIYVYADGQLVGEVRRREWDDFPSSGSTQHRYHHRGTPVITDSFRREVDQ